MQNLPPSDPVLDARLRVLVESYARLTGKPLISVDSPLPLAGEGPGERGSPVTLDSSTLSLTLPLQGGGDEGMDALRIALWNAPFAIVAHGMEDDPIFFYGNRYALQCFEMNFSDFARLPSRLSAEPMNQESREKSLRKVAEQGYIDGYSGMRVASSGRRFMITGCTIWNLVDAAGVYHGQAAVFVAKG
jgi:hypothetical protein